MKRMRPPARVVSHLSEIPQFMLRERGATRTFGKTGQPPCSVDSWTRWSLGQDNCFFNENGAHQEPRCAYAVFLLLYLLIVRDWLARQTLRSSSDLVEYVSESAAQITHCCLIDHLERLTEIGIRLPHSETEKFPEDVGKLLPSVESGIE